MTYSADVEAARTKAGSVATYETCLCCGKEAAGPTVAWDLMLPEDNAFRRVLFHRDCAFGMAQGMICDAWPNRRHRLDAD